MELQPLDFLVHKNIPDEVVTLFYRNNYGDSVQLLTHMRLSDIKLGYLKVQMGYFSAFVDSNVSVKREIEIVSDLGKNLGQKLLMYSFHTQNFPKN